LDVDVDLDYPADVNFRKLDVYQTAVRFLPIAAAMADGLPPRYAAMAEQLRRASLSIPLNIAEGSGKSTGPDQRRFYPLPEAVPWNVPQSSTPAALWPSSNSHALRKPTNFFLPER